MLSAPSGAGKTSLCRAAAERIPGLVYSVSHTTRPPRPGEADGRDYHFVDAATFQAMAERGEFLEWAKVHGHFYGTSRRAVTDVLDGGADVIVDIDAQGARTLMETRPLSATFVFVLTPSFAELERRLRARRSDAEAEIRRRLAKARSEIQEYRRYDYLLVNDDFERAVADLLAVVRAERLSMARADHDWVAREFLGPRPGAATERRS